VVVGAIAGVMWIAAGGGPDQTATSSRKRWVGPGGRSGPEGGQAARAPVAEIPAKERNLGPLVLDPAGVPAGYPVGRWVRVRSGMILLLVLTLVGMLLAAAAASLVIAAALGLRSAAG